jgi:hypothetical protein
MTTNTSTKTAVAPAVAAVNSGDPVVAATYQGMLAVLSELTAHTHIFYDDYSTACNCNCACACTRGIL